VRSLFLKIFVWFWVTLVVVGAAIGVSVWYSSRALDARAAAVMSTIFSTEPQNLRQALAAQSRNINATVSAIEEKYAVHAYFFSADDVKFFAAKKVAPEIQKLAVIAFREEGLHAFGSFASQQNLLANISHELRSPLARLNVALELLKQEGAEKNPEHLQRIALEARRLDTLIGHVLLLSRLDSKVLTTAAAVVDLAVITQEILADAGFEARATSRDVVTGVMDSCAINGHEDLLRSAIENVVRNAVRHTPPGTTVDVSLRREITANPSCGVLRVRDHGPGVPQAMLQEIFRPFARVPSSYAANVSGSGLGLAIAQRAVVAHGGAIRAQNAPDGGLVIEIELPVS
jgi:signal transduction histidine kinase